MSAKADVAKPLSRYAPFRRAGDLIFLAGIVAADPATGKVVSGYADLPPDVRKQAGETGEMSTDMKEGPIAAQSWFILSSLRRTVEAAGGTLDDVVKLTQYFRDLRDFPIYNRIRTLFFPEPPASTVIRVLELLPTRFITRGGCNRLHSGEEDSEEEEMTSIIEVHPRSKEVHIMPYAPDVFVEGAAGVLFLAKRRICRSIISICMYRRMSFRPMSRDGRSPTSRWCSVPRSIISVNPVPASSLI
jgi:enamine deaminase RidA (YjgF/YER057c/UK114 family)